MGDSDSSRATVNCANGRQALLCRSCMALPVNLYANYRLKMSIYNIAYILYPGYNIFGCLDIIHWGVIMIGSEIVGPIKLPGLHDNHVALIGCRSIRKIRKDLYNIKSFIVCPQNFKGFSRGLLRDLESHFILSGLKGIVHFEINFWCVLAYLKGIEDVGVFVSTVVSVFIFFYSNRFCLSVI